MKYCVIISLLIIFSGYLSNEDFFFKNSVLAQTSENKKFLPTLVESNFTIQIINIGIDFPTQMTFVDEKTILVAEKASGKVKEIKNLQLRKNPVLDLNVESGREKGFVGISSAKTSDQQYVFVYYTESVNKTDTHFPKFQLEGNDNNGTKLVRYVWDGHTLKDPELILHPIPYATRVHQGGVMVVQNNNLHLLVGDNYQEDNFLINFPSYKKIYDQGVIFRMDFNGNSVSSNPFKEDPSLSKYFAYGIRNGYGLAIDPITEKIWDTENGPEVFDEINLIYPGFNSGWKKIMGPNVNGSIKVHNLTMIEGSEYSDPEFSWKHPIGVTAIGFLDSKKYGKDYGNSVLVGDVRGNIYRFELNDERNGFVFSDRRLDDKVADMPEENESLIFGKNFGIITDFKTGPDGFLYITSMVQSDDNTGYNIWASHLQEFDVKNQGTMMGVIFRIIPSNLLEDSDMLPPRKQFANGVLPRDINCKEDLQLIFKFTDNSPICVTHSTSQKLLERGWLIN